MDDHNEILQFGRANWEMRRREGIDVGEMPVGNFCFNYRGLPYWVPRPEQIAAETAKIRESWSDEERECRWHMNATRRPLNRRIRRTRRDVA